jgi:hypothetical protein
MCVMEAIGVRSHITRCRTNLELRKKGGQVSLSSERFLNCVLCRFRLIPQHTHVVMCPLHAVGLPPHHL